MKFFKKAFTLIELLVVIGILAVLLAITLIAINPARQFSQSNNTKRASDVLAILNAVYQYAADNKGAVPSEITSSVLNINSTSTPSVCTLLVPTYLAALPVDPLTNNGAGNGAAISTCSGTWSTGYTIVKSSTNNRTTVSAPAAELGQVISVTR